MSPAQIFYVGGMTVICLAFPTLLVGVWAWQALLAAKAPKTSKPHTHTHAAGAPNAA